MSIDKNQKNQNGMLYHKNEYFIMVGFLYKKAKTLGYKKKKRNFMHFQKMEYYINSIVLIITTTRIVIRAMMAICFK